jgi:hypothetical protein
MRIEGYIPEAGTAGAVPLNDFWNSEMDDNLATSSTSMPAGYSKAIFQDGVVFGSQQTGTVPLAIYWSEARKDFLTVASADGVAYAEANGYVLKNATSGYVYQNSPLKSNRKALVTAPTFSQWSRAFDLLIF